MERKDLIKWLSENTTREQWFAEKNPVFLTAFRCNEYPDNWGTWGADVLCVDPKTEAPWVVHNDLTNECICIEDVFCTLTQPVFIHEAIYRLANSDHDDIGHYHYNLNLNRFVHTTKPNVWIRGSVVGPKQEFSAYLVTKEGLPSDEVPPNGTTTEIIGDRDAVSNELMKDGWHGEWDATEPPAMGERRHDPVHRVRHYEVFKGIEAKDIMQVISESGICNHLTPYESHCFFTMLKYRLRAGEKDDLQQDIDKANRYRNCLK